MNPWDIVVLAWESEAEECEGCPYHFHQYWTDTGHEHSCELGDTIRGKPTDCPAYDSTLSLIEEEEEERKGEQ